MRALIDRLLARIAPLQESKREGNLDADAHLADPFADHPPQCKCYFHR